MANFRWVFLFLFLIQFPTASYSQIPVFTLSTTSTDETCFGNGTITFSVSGVDPAATIDYVVYKLPDLVNPVSISNPTVGLTNGTYRVIATQTLGALSNTQSTDVVILNNITPFEYDISSVPNGCGSTSNITINVTSGVATLYEIFAGPVIVSPQPSPTFTNLPPGVYQIRVFNVCGAGSVKTFTLLSGAPQIAISEGSAGDTLPSCTTVNSINLLSVAAGSSINYPLTLVYTVYPPDGSASFTINQTVASGNANNYNASIEMPSYDGDQFTYELSVTDNCGNTFTQSTNVIVAQLAVGISPTIAQCGTYFIKVNVSRFVGPYTITFLQSPATFVPTNFNSGHPTFNVPTVSYGGITAPVPFGTYGVQVTDACGNTATADLTLEDIPAEPTVAFFPFPGCESYKSRVEIQIPGFVIATAIITVAPAGYPNALPHNVTSLINYAGKVIIPELATGTYQIVLTDTCGNTYPPFTFIVPDLATSISAIARTDCTANGLGSVRLAGNGTQLLAVTILVAPTAFVSTTPVPYDVSFNIASDGIFYMANLPYGNYTFKILDSCNIENTIVRYISTYNTTLSSYSVGPQCGTFELTLTHSSNAGAPKFWLQRFDPVSGFWGHPATGVSYTEDTLPDTNTSLQIQANATTLNLTQIGLFRIMKSFESFQDGTPDLKYCWEILHEFTFDGEFQILDIFKLTCDGTLSDVQIVTNGVPPLIFKIVKKNNVPFLIDNGNDNVFMGLEPGLYEFTVQDACGVIKTGSFDVSVLPATVSATQPNDMIQCDDDSNDGIANFDLISQMPAILAGQNPSDVTVTFHNTSADADNGLNSIASADNYIAGNETIYVRVKHNTAGCFETTSFNLIVNPTPQMNISVAVPICVDGTTTLSAAPGFSSYLWSTGETTREITVSSPGNYSVEVTNNYSSGSCSAVYSTTVFQSAPPVITDLTITDWTDNENSITVELSNPGAGDYVFSLDNINFQESNVFLDLVAGVYTVYVKDNNGCGDDQQTIYILSYPKFFTPNGDGFNDFWRVRYAELEPNLKTVIYDRYGKLITMFMPDSPGWDGTFNGRRLLSTDYWFVVIREDGRELKGHFAMKR